MLNRYCKSHVPLLTLGSCAFLPRIASSGYSGELLQRIICTRAEMQFIKPDMCQNIELTLQKCCVPLRACYAENAIRHFALLQLEKKIEGTTWKPSFSGGSTSAENFQAWHVLIWEARFFFCFFLIPLQVIIRHRKLFLLLIQKWHKLTDSNKRMFLKYHQEDQKNTPLGAKVQISTPHAHSCKRSMCFRLRLCLIIKTRCFF